MILVADDDARIRVATAGALSSLGHQVVSASGGAEALDLCADRLEIRLVVTDVLMPGMRGPEFVARAREVRPDLRFIYISGDIGDTPPDAFGGWPLLPKPFTAASLSEVVGQALANQPSA